MARLHDIVLSGQGEILFLSSKIPGRGAGLFIICIHFNIMKTSYNEILTRQARPVTLQKKWSLLLRNSLVNVTNRQFPADFVTFTEEILQGIPHYLCSVRWARSPLYEQSLIQHNQDHSWKAVFWKLYFDASRAGSGTDSSTSEW